MNELTTRETFGIVADRCRFDVQQPVEATEANPGALPLLIGYPIVWNCLSGDRGGYVARFAAGAGKPEPAGVLALYAHDSRDVLGNTANGSLKLSTDGYGVRAEITPPNTSYARDVVELVRGRYIKGMSFGMTRGKWDTSTEDGQKVRTFTEFVFDEVTITAEPAFAQTSVAAQFTRTTDRLNLALAEIRARFLDDPR
jgi:HK97 family phage prohead protease